MYTKLNVLHFTFNTVMKNDWKQPKKGDVDFTKQRTKHIWANDRVTYLASK